MSKRTEYIDTVIEPTTGIALANVQVTVYDVNTTNSVIIYTVRSGGSTKSNPFTTDATGEVKFFVEPGSYDIKFHDTQTPARFSDKTITIEAVSGDIVTGGIAPSQIQRFNSGEIGIANSSGILEGKTIHGDASIDDEGLLTISGAAFTGITSVPIGAMMPYAANTPPAGWLNCDGTEIARGTYPDLYDAIGTTWGAGNGTTTFNLPDLRGRFPLGVDGGANRISASPDLIGQSGGSDVITLTSSQMPSHTHSFSGSGTDSGTTGNVGNHSHGINYTTGFNTATTSVNPVTRVIGIGLGDTTGLATASGAHSHSFDVSVSVSGTTGSAGSSASHDNLPPYAVVRWIIKY